MEKSQREHRNHLYNKKNYRSRYEVDLAVLVVYVSSSSRRWLQSKWSINFELFSEKIPSIQRNQRIVVAIFYTDIFNLLITCA